MHHLKKKLEKGEIYFYTGTGCKEHPDCLTCPFGDCVIGDAKNFQWNNTVVKIES